MEVISTDTVSCLWQARFAPKLKTLALSQQSASFIIRLEIWLYKTFWDRLDI